MTVFDDIGNSVVDTGSDFGNNVKDGFDSTVDGFQDFGNSMGEGFNWFGEQIKDIPGFLKKIEGYGIDRIKQLLDEFGINPQMLLYLLIAVGVFIVVKK